MKTHKENSQKNADLAKNLANKRPHGDANISIIQKLYNKNVVCINPDCSVFEAAKIMVDKQIGDLIVTEEKENRTVPVGIITDRDIVLKTTAKNISPETIKVSQVMTNKIITANECDDILDVVDLMMSNGVSRLPILDDKNNLVGILTSKRLFQYLARGLFDLSTISEIQQQKESKTH